MPQKLYTIELIIGMLRQVEVRLMEGKKA